MKIVIGNDHAAPELKLAVVEHLKKRGVDYIDMGCGIGEKCDYPNKAKEVCEKVISGEYDLGILICGTGVGMSMAANKIKGIRAACCSDCFSARLTREHNDANVLCFGERVVGVGTAIDLVDTFIDTPYSHGERHQKRIDLISELEG